MTTDQYQHHPSQGPGAIQDPTPMDGLGDQRSPADASTAPGARPLKGLVVLDLAQFLAGPMAALRLGDMGARVLKVERAGTGELGRSLLLAEQRLSGASGLFQTVNRGKESIAADFRDPADLQRLRQLIVHADVLIEAFRPGVLDRVGLGWEDVRRLNPRLVYASVTGYGAQGPWAGLPGQDLLVQARSGLLWINGRSADPPTPAGLSMVDVYTGALLTQGILAALVRRGISGDGARVETSLLEAATDLQLEHLTVFLNAENGVSAQPERGSVATAHPYLPAPYGVYATADHWLAIAMAPLSKLGPLLDLADLGEGLDAYRDRDEIKTTIAARLRTRTRAEWLALLQTADIWCAEVLDWADLTSSQAWDVAGLEQRVGPLNQSFRTTRCPIRIDGRVLLDDRAAPELGVHGPLPPATDTERNG